MKICGIVCEFNPLHNGHLRLLRFAKEQSGCDVVLCVMSGNFSQRGEPCLLEKTIRAKHAVLAGADAVLELPFVFATASAEDFALGAIRILQAVGADTLCFGSECGDAPALRKAADFLSSKNFEPHLQNGNSYAKAADLCLREEGITLLEEPNNLLAVTYLLACQKQNYSPRLLTLRRDRSENATICTSRTIREAVDSDQKSTVKACVPAFVYDDLPTKTSLTAYRQFAFSSLATQSAANLREIYGVCEGLEHRILQAARTSSDFEDLLLQCKTKRYTLLKLQRILLHAAVGLTKAQAERAKLEPVYFVPLALNEAKADEILGLLARRGTFLKQAEGVAKSFDQTADRLYRSLTGEKIAKNAPSTPFLRVKA